MTTRAIPALHRSTAPIGLGCMGMSWAYATPDASDDVGNVDVIRAALDRGITLLDTSDVYASGHNERLVGSAIAGRRDDAIIATKGGLVSCYRDGKPHLDRDGSPAHLRTAIDDSLTRLGVDHIDLYYLHRIDPAVPLEASWAALAEAVTAGKVLVLGLSEVTTAEADRAHAIHPVAAIQSELSLWTRDALGQGSDTGVSTPGNVVAWCRDHEATFVPFSPLGRGFLTGELKVDELEESDLRTTLPRFTGAAATQNLALLDTIRRVAQRHDTTAAAIALAWVLAQRPHVIPIPGTTKTARLDENLSAATVTLTPQDLAELHALPAAIGGRY